MTDFAALVQRAIDPATAPEFDDRVRAQADRLAAAVDDGDFDNEEPTLGLELEAYAVREGEDGLHVAPLPEDVFDGPAAKELGLHNAELNADPTPFDEAGIDAQAEAIAADLEATRERAAEHDLEIVLDAMWAVAPAAGTEAYIDDVEVRDDGDGQEGDVPIPSADGPVFVARNMRRDPRYGALDNEAVRRAGGAIEFSVPESTRSYRTILFESLATSIQPHVQVPDVESFPQYHNLATRTLGPLLALSTNSPFLPADCYDVDDSRALVAETHHELRIAAFEQSMNQDCRKVRVPADLDDPSDAVEHVVADDTFAPFLSEWLEGEGDESDSDGPDAAGGGDGSEETEHGTPGSGDPLDTAWEFDYKRGTFWRWVRGVAGGDAVDGACDSRSLRIEYRPLPTQPTIRDVVGLQVLTAGLLWGLVATDHPLRDLPWDAAEESFYSAVENGLDADLAWVTADGERTEESDAIFAEVFDLAREGLADRGVDSAARERYLAPIQRRWETGVTPSAWKKRRVREALDDGVDLATALARMQREYVELSRETDSFAEWL